PLVEVVSDSKGEFHLERASNIVGLKSGALMGLAYWKAPMKVTLTMMPVKAIRIRAVDILGRPVAGAVIGPEALGTESNYQRIREGSQIFKRFACTTDSSGRATLENIPSKASVFLAVEDEHLAIRRNTARIQAHRNDDEVTVVLELASTVSGTVTSGGKPAPHSYVFAYSTNEVAPSFTPTDENGRFVLKHQPLGRLVLVGQTRHDFAHNWSDAEAHVDVPIARGTNDSGTDDVELKAGSGSPLKVRVVSPAGRPLGGLDVRVHLSGMEGMAPAGGTTDSNGEFECRAYPGPHKVVVDQWTEELTQTVDVRPGASNLVTIHAPIDEKDARVVCRLIDARGKQLGATTVTIECTDFHGKRIKLRYVTDQFGKAIVSIPESRVKTMSASARSGNEVSDPRIRPHNGVIEIRLHRP
ncbi:MAG: carboxypeptidase-like regulatory domain-containing protein, partial [Fimbriimonas sp.]|nr:carboxypeptidase-like regulatory domain-containing protein [Fimbriimonas sp.]